VSPLSSSTVHARSRRRADRGAARTESEARRLRDILRSNVFARVYPAGLLPSESELMLTYSAPRAAVREALSMLRREAVVERVQGIGTFSVAERYVGTMDELHGAEAADGDPVLRRTRADVLDRTVVPAVDAVARRLQIERGDPVLRLEYVAYLDSDPIGMATNYVAFPEADALREASFRGDWYTLMEEAGVLQGGSEWVIGAVNADPIVARHLDVAPGTALMLGEELIWDVDGRPFDFAVCYTRTDRFVFSSQTWTVRSRSGDEPLIEDNLAVRRSVTA
jgi:GntR family transcriptional regulator